MTALWVPRRVPGLRVEVPAQLWARKEANETVNSWQASVYPPGSDSGGWRDTPFWVSQDLRAPGLAARWEEAEPRNQLGLVWPGAGRDSGSGSTRPRRGYITSRGVPGEAAGRPGRPGTIGRGAPPSGALEVGCLR